MKCKILLFICNVINPPFKSVRHLKHLLHELRFLCNYELIMAWGGVRGLFTTVVLEDVTMCFIIQLTMTCELVLTLVCIASL